MEEIVMKDMEVAMLDFRLHSDVIDNFTIDVSISIAISKIKKVKSVPIAPPLG